MILINRPNIFRDIHCKNVDKFKEYVIGRLEIAMKWIRREYRIKKFYCDESGNTGNNYLDDKDPFFVLGGWLGEDIENDIELQEFLGSGELKANKLLKSVAGRKKVLKILKYLFKRRYIPFLAIVHKKYAIAARIEDVLLDPEYNDCVPSRITYDEAEVPKKMLADMLFYLDDEVLEEFAIAYKNIDVCAMKKCIKNMCNNLDRLKWKEFKYVISNSLKRISENLTDEKDYKKKQAPNYFSANTLMLILNQYAEKEKINIHFIHDIQKEYSASLLEMVELKVKKRDDMVRYGHKKYHVFFNNIDSFEFKDSKEKVGLQCADLLVGTTNYVLKKLLANCELDDIDRELVGIIFKNIILFNGRQRHFMIENQTGSRIMNDAIKVAKISKWYILPRCLLGMLKNSH